MHHYTWIYAKHLFILPRKDITKFFEEGGINLDLIWRTRNPDMAIFDNPWFDIDLDGNCSLNVSHVSFGQNFMNQNRCEVDELVHQKQGFLNKKKSHKGLGEMKNDDGHHSMEFPRAT